MSALPVVDRANRVAKAKKFMEAEGTVVILEALAQFYEDTSHQGCFTPDERDAYGLQARIVRAMQMHPVPQIIRKKKT